jgi:hypothetical protein
MTCYQRHLGWMFEALDIPYDKEHRAGVDAALKVVLGLAPDTHCPEVWSAIKALPESEREALVPEVAARVNA